MNPRTIYIEDRSKTINLGIKVKPVIVEGYRDQISLDCFEHTTKNLLYKLSYEKYKSLEPYGCSFRVWDKFDIETHNASSARCGGKFPLITIEDNPITLREYYKEIGYDYKTKKINGQTWAQRVADHMKKIKEKNNDSTK